MRFCHFGVSPVNYSDSDSAGGEEYRIQNTDPSEEIIDIFREFWLPVFPASLIMCMQSANDDLNGGNKTLLKVLHA